MSVAREHRIYNFTGNLIAFHRPRKNTYYLMSWSAQQRYWSGATIQPNVSPVKMHGSGLHRFASYVTIRLQNSSYVEIRSIGNYLRIGECDVPIVMRVAGPPIPMSIVNNDFGGITSGEPYLRNVELWSVPPVPTEAEVAATAAAALAAAARGVRVQGAVVAPIKPLPKRIAWMVAEDAGKNGDTCAITMEPINPITAAATTCFHCFDHEAIQTWMQNHTTCPQCRERCLVTKAFED
jgi:hypothetical protein